ncbi:MAG: hypothetical protein JSV83_01745 [Desulfobacterales bacterium]|nr:MAG: hypothetical protein JSV83_01745 [Desulfobacterales bacterium]
MGAITVGLDFVWELIEPILSDAVKERLKPKDSPTKAKERIFKLYEVLGKVRDRTDEFLEKLRVYVDDVESGALAASMEDFRRSPAVKEAFSRGEIVPPPDNSRTSLRNVGKALLIDLKELKQALNRVNPQLSIYGGKIVPYSDEYIRARLEVYQDSLSMPMEPKELRKLLSRAEVNQRLIKDAIEQTQEFIKTEFSFKDSF